MRPSHLSKSVIDQLSNINAGLHIHVHVPVRWKKNVHNCYPKGYIWIEKKTSRSLLRKILQSMSKQHANSWLLTRATGCVYIQIQTWLVAMWLKSQRREHSRTVKVKGYMQAQIHVYWWCYWRLKNHSKKFIIVKHLSHTRKIIIRQLEVICVMSPNERVLQMGNDAF